MNQMETKNQPIKDFLTGYLPAILVIGLGVIFSLKSDLVSFFGRSNNIPGQTGVVITSGVENIIVEQTSGTDSSGSLITGEVIYTEEVIPQDARGYIDYILRNGEAGKDYFIINPIPQPVIHGQTAAENNQVLFDYVYKYRSKIPFSKNQGGYILITLNNPIADNGDIFLAINGKSMGALSKKLSEPVYDEKEFLYNIKNIPAGGYDISLSNYINNGYIDIGGFVGESGNGIKSITIVLK